MRADVVFLLGEMETIVSTCLSNIVQVFELRLLLSTLSLSKHTKISRSKYTSSRDMTMSSLNSDRRLIESILVDPFLSEMIIGLVEYFDTNSFSKLELGSF